MEFSKHLASVEGSVTAQIFAKARLLEFAGKDIVHLEIGQPDFKPHPVILQGVADAVLAGNTSYTVSRGTLDFRKEIGNYHKQVNQSNLNPATEIVVTSGAKLALFGSLWGLINPGDNIIVLNPSWVSYSDIIMSLGGEVKWVDVDHNFNYDENELRSEINDRTKAILVNSPSNPTGSVISQVGISTLFDICAESGIYLISDEIYSEYLYDGKTHSSLLDINNWMDHGIVINGLSKTFSMTGFRLGYTLANEQISNNVNKVNQLTASCPVNFAQMAGIIALQNVHDMRKIIHSIMPKRREMMTEMLSELPVEYHAPSGAFYSWVKIPTEDSTKWAEDLLQSQGVAVTPGPAFGPAGKSFIRLSFANADTALIDGIGRIKVFLNE